MSNLILPLGDVQATSPEIAGGKGASLARMVVAGFPVPLGFVVSARVYASCTSSIAGRIRDAIAGVASEDVSQLVGASEKVRDLFAEVVIPPGTLEDLETAWEALGSGAVSVRSSATDEDLAEASFAGQYETYLNVLTFGELVERLVQVWWSTYSPRAIAYRIGNRLPLGDVGMAVVVQRQLLPEAAGVMFTRNPVTGAGEYVVNAALGLGEGVVAGTVETDQFKLDPATGTVLSSTVAKKKSRIVEANGPGVERAAVPSDLVERPALDEPKLRELASLGRGLVDLFGGPQDIEFAVSDGEILLLQSRPVTAAEGTAGADIDWESLVDPEYRWSLGSMSMQAGPLYRLEQDLVEAYAAGAQQCFEETGAGFTRLCILKLVHGYSYLRDPDVDDNVAEERRSDHNASCEDYYQRGTSYYDASVRPRLDAMLANVWRLRRAGSGLRSRVAYLDGALRHYGLAMGHLHWCLDSLETRPPFPEVYHEITGEPSENALVFQQALSHTTSRMVARLRGLARLVQDDPELSAVFAERRFEDIRSPALRNKPGVRRFRRRFSDFMRVFGLRNGYSYGSFNVFETPTWNMDPARPLNIIATYTEQDLDEMDRLSREALKQRVEATRRIRRELAKDPDRLARFEYALTRARGEVVMMEDHNHQIEQCTVGHFRDAIHLTGTALVKFGRLDAQDDVFHLSMEELRLLADEKGPADLRVLVGERRAEREQRKLLSPPPTLGAPASDVPEDSESEERPEGDEDVIQGTPASRGRVTGPARLVTATTRVDEWRRGDIMVAANVGQDFTPVFPLLGALVLDGGAVFQHAALVAREYRIPAVVMAGDATKRIADGQVITVDGGTGVIYVGTSELRSK